MTREPDSGGGRSKLDGNAVDAVALIGRRLEAFSLEHMAQMPAARCACDLYPPTIRVRRPVYGSREPFEEGRPATAGVEFGGGLVQGRSAANAVVRPVTIELVVLACSRQPGSQCEVSLMACAPACWHHFQKLFYTPGDKQRLSCGTSEFSSLWANFSSVSIGFCSFSSCLVRPLWVVCTS